MSRLDDVINALSTCSSLAEASAKLGMSGGAIRGVLRRAGLRSSSFMAGDEIPVEWSEPVEDVKPDVSSAPTADRTYVEKPADWWDQREFPALDCGKELERVMILPDIHYPYHDVRAMRLVNKVARAFRPHTLAQLGDLVDCFTVSFHDRDPRRGTQLKSETDMANEGLDELDAVPDVVRRFFVEGNHEYRLQRYLMSNAPALLDMVNIHSILRLRERGWHFTPYRQHSRVGKLNLTHEVGHSGVYAAKQTADAMGSNVGFVHTHRAGTHYSGLVTGERHVSANFGWLGDAKEARYLSEAQKRSWQLAFGIAHLEKNGNCHVQVIPIVDYRCVVDGKLYSL